VLRINILKSYLGLRERASHDDYASVWETMIKSANHFLRSCAAYFTSPTRSASSTLPLVMATEWSQLFDLFPWLLAVLQERDE
jgi:hypothetical protein